MFLSQVLALCLALNVVPVSGTDSLSIEFTGTSEQWDGGGVDELTISSQSRWFDVEVEWSGSGFAGESSPSDCKLINRGMVQDDGSM